MWCVAGDLWISAVALLISGGSAGVAGLSYRQANRFHREAEQFRRDAYFGEVTGFQATIVRKQVLKALESEWDVGGVHDSVRELRDDLAERLSKLPAEARPAGKGALEACVDLLVGLRPWATNQNKARIEIHSSPEVVAIITKWKQTIDASLTQLDDFLKGPGARVEPPS